MPVSIKTTEPKADVPFAKSPEFQKLQDAINQAKEALDDVSRQIVAIESKLNPTARPNGRPGGDDIPNIADALGAPQPDTAPGPNSGPGPMEPHPGYPTSYDPSPSPATSGDYPAPASQAPARRARPSFEEAIEDMRRIAGLR